MRRAKLFKNESIQRLAHFVTYLGLIGSELDIYFAAIYRPPNIGSRLVFADGSDDPFQARLAAALGQQEVF
jgi:hypothetical protein